MKKIFSTIAIAVSMLFAATTANAQQTSAKDVTIGADGTAVVEFNITDGNLCSGTSLEVTLPEGLTFQKVMNEDEELELFSKGTALKSSHQVIPSANELSDSHAWVVVMSLAKATMKASGSVFTFVVKESPTFKGGKIKFDHIDFETGVSNTAFEIEVTSSTGVAGVAADIADKDVAKYTKNNKLFLKKGKKTFNGNGSIVGEE